MRFRCLNAQKLGRELPNIRAVKKLKLHKTSTEMLATQASVLSKIRASRIHFILVRSGGGGGRGKGGGGGGGCVGEIVVLIRV